MSSSNSESIESKKSPSEGDEAVLPVGKAKAISKGPKHKGNNAKNSTAKTTQQRKGQKQKQGNSPKQQIACSSSSSNSPGFFASNQPFQEDTIVRRMNDIQIPPELRMFLLRQLRQTVAVVRELVPEHKFLLFGEIPLDLDFFINKMKIRQVPLDNQGIFDRFRPVRRSLKLSNRIEFDLDHSSGGLVDFQYIIEALRSMKNEVAQNFALELQTYQNTVRTIVSRNQYYMQQKQAQLQLMQSSTTTDSTSIGGSQSPSAPASPNSAAGPQKFGTFSEMNIHARLAVSLANAETIINSLNPEKEIFMYNIISKSFNGMTTVKKGYSKGLLLGLGVSEDDFLQTMSSSNLHLSIVEKMNHASVYYTEQKMASNPYEQMHAREVIRPVDPMMALHHSPEHFQRIKSLIQSAIEKQGEMAAFFNSNPILDPSTNEIILPETIDEQQYKSMIAQWQQQLVMRYGDEEIIENPLPTFSQYEHFMQNIEPFHAKDQPRLKQTAFLHSIASALIKQPVQKNNLPQRMQEIDKHLQFGKAQESTVKQNGGNNQMENVNIEEEMKGGDEEKEEKGMIEVEEEAEEVKRRRSESQIQFLSELPGFDAVSINIGDNVSEMGDNNIISFNVSDWQQRGMNQSFCLPNRSEEREDTQNGVVAQAGGEIEQSFNVFSDQQDDAPRNLSESISFSIQPSSLFFLNRSTSNSSQNSLLVNNLIEEFQNYEENMRNNNANQGTQQDGKAIITAAAAAAAAASSEHDMQNSSTNEESQSNNSNGNAQSLKKSSFLFDETDQQVSIEKLNEFYEELFRFTGTPSDKELGALKEHRRIKEEIIREYEIMHSLLDDRVFMPDDVFNEFIKKVRMQPKLHKRVFLGNLIKTQNGENLVNAAASNEKNHDETQFENDQNNFDINKQHEMQIEKPEGPQNPSCMNVLLHEQAQQQLPFCQSDQSNLQCFNNNSHHNNKMCLNPNQQHCQIIDCNSIEEEAFGRQKENDRIESQSSFEYQQQQHFNQQSQYLQQQQQQQQQAQEQIEVGMQFPDFFEGTSEENQQQSSQMLNMQQSTNHSLQQSGEYSNDYQNHNQQQQSRQNHYDTMNTRNQSNYYNTSIAPSSNKNMDDHPWHFEDLSKHYGQLRDNHQNRHEIQHDIYPHHHHHHHHHDNDHQRQHPHPHPHPHPLHHHHHHHPSPGLLVRLVREYFNADSCSEHEQLLVKIQQSLQAIIQAGYINKRIGQFLSIEGNIQKASEVINHIITDTSSTCSQRPPFPHLQEQQQSQYFPSNEAGQRNPHDNKELVIATADAAVHAALLSNDSLGLPPPPPPPPPPLPHNHEQLHGGGDRKHWKKKHKQKQDEVVKKVYELNTNLCEGTDINDYLEVFYIGRTKIWRNFSKEFALNHQYNQLEHQINLRNRSSKNNRATNGGEEVNELISKFYPEKLAQLANQVNNPNHAVTTTTTTSKSSEDNKNIKSNKSNENIERGSLPPPPVDKELVQKMMRHLKMGKPHPIRVLITMKKALQKIVHFLPEEHMNQAFIKNLLKMFVYLIQGDSKNYLKCRQRAPPHFIDDIEKRIMKKVMGVPII